MTAVVIGSGPAAAAATRALCDAGLNVTVLDAGDTVEPERVRVFDELALNEPEQWPPELVRRARDAFPADIGHVPLKPAFGSLFPYVQQDPDLSIATENADTLSSLAYGGLSNAWGASLLPVRQPDIEDWPISLAALVPHYEAVQRFVPVSAERDELSETLPLYTDDPGKLRRSEQTQQLLTHMRRHRDKLQAAGLNFGASRLAVTSSTDGPHRCRNAGLCLYGCPYRSIYCAAHTFESLRRDARIEYRGGIYVDRVTESEGTVTIDFHERRRPKARGQLSASRVFVACGAISSTRLMLTSMRRVRHVCRMHDSQYFVIPAVMGRAAPVSAADQGNTLAQAFLELDGGHVSANSIHMQIYGYNDIMLSALAKRLRVAPERLEPIARSALGRLVIVQGFLHSADSPGLTIEYDADHLRIVGDDVGVGRVRVRALVRRLALHSLRLGMLPAPGVLHLGRPGKSNHLGGSFPMRRSPGEFETDILGRVPGWQRVHLVDSAVFPSVPATTVTISAMANAHRIATATANLPDAQSE